MRKIQNLLSKITFQYRKMKLLQEIDDLTMAQQEVDKIMDETDPDLFEKLVVNYVYV